MPCHPNHQRIAGRGDRRDGRGRCLPFYSLSRRFTRLGKRYFGLAAHGDGLRFRLKWRRCRLGLVCPGLVCPRLICPGLICPGLICPRFICPALHRLISRHLGGGHPVLAHPVLGWRRSKLTLQPERLCTLLASLFYSFFKPFQDASPPGDYTKVSNLQPMIATKAAIPKIVNSSYRIRFLRSPVHQSIRLHGRPLPNYVLFCVSAGAGRGVHLPPGSQKSTLPDAR